MKLVTTAAILFGLVAACAAPNATVSPRHEASSKPEQPDGPRLELRAVTASIVLGQFLQLEVINQGNRDFTRTNYRGVICGGAFAVRLIDASGTVFHPGDSQPICPAVVRAPYTLQIRAGQAMRVDVGTREAWWIHGALSEPEDRQVPLRPGRYTAEVYGDGIVVKTPIAITAP